jgi:Protein of unknown function (DUF2934)
MAKTRKRSGSATIAADAPVVPPPTPEPQHDVAANGQTERIAARAYELYLARGGAHGSDWEDWLTAERELTGARSDTKER